MVVLYKPGARELKLLLAGLIHHVARQFDATTQKYYDFEATTSLQLCFNTLCLEGAPCTSW